MRYHIKRPRKPKYPEHKIIEQDLAIQRYFTTIKGKARNKGILSERTKIPTIIATRLFLNFLQIPITDHALTDLIKVKQQTLNSFDLDDKLEIFANQEPITSYRNYATYIKGIFKANRTPLNAFVDNHFHRQTEPISEGILKQIYTELNQEFKDIIDLQAYTGQRREVINLLPIEQIDLTKDSELAVIHIKPNNTGNKTKLEYYTFIPKDLAGLLHESTVEISFAWTCLANLHRGYE